MSERTIAELEARLESLQRSQNAIDNTKKMIEAELDIVKKKIRENRLERMKKLEKHFASTPYPGSFFRMSSAKRDTVKLVLYDNENSVPKGGLYEYGPSFAVILALLEKLEASGS